MIGRPFLRYLGGRADIGELLDRYVEASRAELHGERPVLGRLTSLLTLGELYCDLEEIFHKKIDLVTVRAVMQDARTDSDRDFRDTVMRERVKLNDVA